MLRIKDIKNSQYFNGVDTTGEVYEFKAWGDPFLIDGVWHIEATDAGDYCFTFNEQDENMLHPAVAPGRRHP